MSFWTRLKNLFGLSSDDNQREQRKRYGVVNYYNRKKGYGFIQSDDMDERVFMHISNAEDKVKVGSAVSFFLNKNKKGFFAEEIRLVK